MKKSAPIGIFDSGMGGLSVWHEVRRLLPEESVIYLADGKNCPYGDRSAEDIAALTRRAVVELLARGAKLIVVACNTATAVAIDALREEFDVPFVGMEPAVKPAALATKTGKIGILATRASLAGDLFRTTSAKYASQVEILTAVGEGFVELVERGMERSDEAEVAVRRVVEPLLATDIDKIVLGCTHYPFLRPLIERVIGNRDIAVIDSGEAVARRVEWLLERYDIAAGAGHRADFRFVSFADESYRQALQRRAQMIVEELNLCCCDI
jgi:glutamate racemase